MASGWSLQSIAGKPADVFDPPGKPRFGVLFLHPVGLETLAGNAAYTEELAARNLACICPHGGPFWWTDRPCAAFDPALTSEQFLLREVVPGFERWGLRPRAIGL